MSETIIYCENPDRESVKLFRAMVWSPEPEAIGKRVVIFAETLEEARRLVRAQFGEEATISLRSADEDEKIRQGEDWADVDRVSRREDS
jgi:hypothetical protein